jgi:hypothetical protein
MIFKTILANLGKRNSGPSYLSQKVDMNGGYFINPEDYESTQSGFFMR